MPFFVRLYLNTALASILLFILLALWGGYNAIRDGANTPTYTGALISSQVVLLVLCLLYGVLRFLGLLASQTLLPLIYHLVALAVLPSARLYIHEQSSRRTSVILALACVFTSGMILRALQTGAAPR